MTLMNRFHLKDYSLSLVPPAHKNAVELCLFQGHSMKKNTAFFFFSLFLIILCGSACSPAVVDSINIPAKTSIIDPTQTVTRQSGTALITPAPGLPKLTETAENPPAFEVAPQSNSEYEIKVSFNYGLQQASVKQQIIYSNALPQTINSFLLACDPLRYKSAINIKEVFVNEQAADVEIGSYWLKINLKDPLLQGEGVTINISFELSLPPIPEPADDRKPAIFGYTPLQSNFADWYPMIVPRDENGQWILHDPWYYGEYLVYDLANYSIDIKIEDFVENLRVAASTKGEMAQDGSFLYQHENARNFVFSIGPSYQSSQTMVGDISISSYYFSFHKAAGEQVLQETAKAVELYSRLFGPMHKNNLTIVEADFLDGMEFDGFYFLSRGFYNLFDGTPKGYLTTIAVHETAHQWWYTAVANDQALQPWLDEALCTYSEYLYYENIYPQLSSWWWAYRVDFYNPIGTINAPIYDYQGFVPYRDAVYLQGAKFFQALRAEMGDIAFFEFLQNYRYKFDGKRSSESEFWQLAEQASTNDLSQVRSTFFKATP